MPERIDKESIRSELSSIRDEMRNLSSIAGANPLLAGKHSDWSAHGDWSSGSSKLNGNFSVSSRLGNPTKIELLEDAIKDASSSKFIEVAKEISEVVKEG